MSSAPGGGPESPDRVVLDTNSFTLEAPLSSNPERLILDAASKGQVILVVPELIVREVVNKWRELARSQADKARAQIDKLTAYGMAMKAPTRNDVARRGDDVEQEMRERLAAAGAQISDFPKVPHEDVVQRALDRRQPFDSAGKDGYRDAVLWHVVLEEAADARVILISNDGRAFADKDNEHELASHLRDEVDNLTGDRDRVTLTRELRELTDGLAQVDQATLEKVEGLVRERSVRTLLEEAIEHELPGHRLGMDSVVKLNLGIPVDDAHVAGMGQLGVVTPVRAYTLPDGEALVELDIVAGLVIGIVFANRGFAQAFRNEPNFWLTTHEGEWEDIGPSDPVFIATNRLGHVRADVSIALPEGRLDGVQVVAITVAEENEEFVEADVTDDDA